MSSTFNIFRNATISNCTSCIHDNRLGYGVSWVENNNLNGYSTVSNITSYTTWDGVYFGVSSSSSCYISQDNDIQVDASVYNVVKVTMRVDVGHHVVDLPTKGKIEFKTVGDSSWPAENIVEFDINPDNSYREYSVDMSIISEWSGTINRFRVYPFVDGTAGLKIHLKSIEVESRNTYGCDTAYSDSVCSKFYEYVHPCPWIGSPGKVVSTPVNSRLTIQENVNDCFLLNIGEFGDQKITLRPVVSGSLNDIAFDIQDKINTVGIGGYSSAKCYVSSSNEFNIEADFFGSDSTVSISQPETYSACSTLGFVSHDAVDGTSSATEYITAPFQIDSSIISGIRGSNSISDAGIVSLMGDDYSVYGGNKNYALFIKDNKLTFRNQTVVDYNNPIIQNGLIKKIYFSGDCFNNTEFRIYRQNIDGVFTIVHTVDFSVASDETDLIFEKNVSLRVRRGDLLGVYSGSLHTGLTLEKANFSYILYDGDLISGTYSQPLTGTGEGGLPLYVRGEFKKNKAIIDLSFDSVLPLEEVFIRADEDTVDEEISMCTLRSGGVGGGPHITTRTGLDSVGVQAPGILNADALIDGLKQNVNVESPYCYPGWLDLPPDEQEKYAYTDFSIVLDFAKGVDVLFDICRVKFYFVSNKNIKLFGLKVPIAFSSDDTSQVWDYGWNRYNTVITDVGLLDSETIYLYDNPSILTSSNYQVSYTHLDYKYLDLSFNNYKARSIKYDVSFGDSLNTDTYDSNYSYFPLSPDPKIQEIEVFAKSTPSKNITNNFLVESSYDGYTYLLHTDINEYEVDKIGFTIGRPSRFLRLTIEAENTLVFKNLECSLSENYIKVETDAHEGVNLNTPIDVPEQFPGKITITNTSQEMSGYYINIYSDSAKSDKCILFNRLSSDDEVKQSVIGSGGITRKRESLKLRPYNYAYKCPSYYLDRNFIFGNTSYISYNNKTSWVSIGSTVTDGSDSSYVTNEFEEFHLYPNVYVCVDLKDNYSVSNVVLKNPTGTLPFSNSVLYSCMDTDDPNNIPTSSLDPNGWLVTSKGNARWVLLQASSAKPGGTGIKHLSGLLVDLDFGAALNNGKLPWVSSNDLLTDGISEYLVLGSDGSWISNDDAYYYCVDLRWWFDISNIMVGPFSSSGSGVTNTDILVAGDSFSYINSSYVSANVAYSNTNTEDPSEVLWGAFGDDDNHQAKWVLLKTTTRIDDIIVHINSNIQNDKPSFLNKYWFSSGSADLYEEYADNPSGVCAIALDYPANTITDEYILLNQNLGIDYDLAKRDSLGFWLYVSDVDQIDSTYGYIQVGKSITQANTLADINLTFDDYNYYQWSFSDFSSSLEDGWNYIKLPFSDNYKHAKVYFTEDDKSRIGGSTYRDRITYIKFLFRGAPNNSLFTARLSDFSILRRYYSESEFDYGVYVPDGDFVKFSLGGFNPYAGSVEFFIKPDWSKSLVSSSGNPNTHTIFRIFNTEDNSLFSLFKTGDGLQLHVTDGTTRIQLTDKSNSIIGADTPTHVAVSWDFEGKYCKDTISLYINGINVVSLTQQELLNLGKEINFNRNSLYTLMLGGHGWEGLLSSFVSSADAVFENLKVYNYPVKDFSGSINNLSELSCLSSSELIELSLDGVNYFGYCSGLLPLIKANVGVNEKFNVYVRGKNLSNTADGQHNRQPYIYVSRIKA